ncbi:MAG: polar amino acid transport system substrate-binding protein [Desulfobacteraceae bacterium Eth-SRB2]|nr:MAG: polar amino acid transport system substrate-binding protein [Desulfobacteraceae bacterium Eth-SRB2]
MKRVKLFFVLLLVWVFTSACAHMMGFEKTSPTIHRILQRGELVVGTAGNMPPLNMTDKKGEIIGLEVDMAHYFAGAMGVELNLVKKPFSELLPALEAGEVDMVISGMTITPERNLKVAFAGPYIISGKAFLTKDKFIASAKEASELNLSKFRIVALESSTSETLVKEIMPTAKLITTKNYDAAVEMVLQDKVDALVADYQICLVSLLRYPDQGLVSVISPFTYEPLGIALPAGDPHLLNWVNNFLNTLKKSDELDKLRARWIMDGSWLKELQ